MKSFKLPICKVNDQNILINAFGNFLLYVSTVDAYGLGHELMLFKSTINVTVLTFKINLQGKWLNMFVVKKFSSL